ncbi:hypothetical protein [Alteromonas sp. S167]|uniref:hypothetical protein n=1 Tax=Alteromonas sp. S167 TaxID=3117402 RepID=UPI002FDFA23B
MGNVKRLLVKAAGLVALFSVLNANASIITVGTFTGGDVGEGLDFDGNFVYAVNARGAGGFSIGDATFTTDTTQGVSLSAVNEILNWHTADYGNTANDNNLETVMRSIRWSPRVSSGNQLSTYKEDVLTIDLANLNVGATYSLQLLFAENCCTRGFDVFLEGSKAVDNFAPYVVQSTGLSSPIVRTPNVGAFIRYDFTASDSVLNIAFGGDAPFSDNNPIINGFTLEATEVSAPSTLAIFAFGLISLTRLRRK